MALRTMDQPSVDRVAWRRRVGILSLLSAIAFAAAACVASPTATAPGGLYPAALPTPCRGSHAWPPNGYQPAPAGVTAEMPNGGVVRVVNSTGRDYWYRVSEWRDQDCLGWNLDHEIGFLEFEYERGPLPKHSQIDAAIVFSTNRPEDLRIGVGIWDHRCGEACSGPRIAFITVPPSDIAPGST